VLFRGLRWLFLTHRGGLGKREIQETLAVSFDPGAEAYLLPGLKVTTTFEQEFPLSFLSQVIWTGPFSWLFLPFTPVREVLFSGRHLLLNQLGEPVPGQLKPFTGPDRSRAFSHCLTALHRKLLYICPGANTGFPGQTGN